MPPFTRRKFLGYSAAATMGVALPVGVDLSRAPVRVLAIDPTAIPKYTSSMPVPPAMPQAGTFSAYDYYEIAAGYFRQQILPAGYPTTPVFGYGAVSIAASPDHVTVADTAAFTIREHLSKLPNWRFLTDTASQLRQVWTDYAIAVRSLAAGSAPGRSNVTFVIDAAGQVRSRLADDQALWTPAGEASFAGLLAQVASSVR